MINEQLVAKAWNHAHVPVVVDNLDFADNKHPWPTLHPS